MLLEMILEQATEKPEPKPTSQFAGRWQNRLGSSLELSVDGAELTGTFRSGVGVWNPATGFRVRGFVEGDAISFCVDFGARGSVAAWSGHFVEDEGGDRLVRRHGEASSGMSPRRTSTNSSCKLPR